MFVNDAAQRSGDRILPTQIGLDNQPGVAKLAGLGEKDFLALCEAIKSVPQGLRPKQFKAAVGSSVPRLSKGDVEEVIQAAMYLASFRAAEASLPEFVKNAVAEAQSLGLSPEHALTLNERLHVLLRLESIRLLSKVLELSFEASQVFHSTRILTDLRPVFALASGLDVKGLMVVHTLKIEYFTGEGTKETYISMDDDDIARLSQVLERAKKKAEVLRAFIAKCQVPDLSPGESSENA
jgi:hypothetical protein